MPTRSGNADKTNASPLRLCVHQVQVWLGINKVKSKNFLIVSLCILGLSFLIALLVVFAPTPKAELNPPSLDGPGDLQVYGLAGAPNNPDQICAGTWGEGLFCSQNGGQSWRAAGMLPDSESRRVKTAIWTPDNRIYIGTWQGVYQSNDNGETWNSISIPPVWLALPGTGDPLQVNSLLRGDAQGTVIYAGTRGGILKSTDGGKSWTPKNANLRSAALDIQLLIQDPGQSEILYIGTTRDGIYRSTDGAETWEPTQAFTNGVKEVYSLVSPRSGVLFAGTKGLGVYRSTDAGETWQAWNDGIDNDEHARTIQALAVGPDGAIYAGTVDFGIYKLTSDQTKWQSKNNGLGGYALSILNIASIGTNRLYLGTYGGGVYVSSDGGETWEEHSQGIETFSQRVQSLALDTRGKRLFAGTNGAGVYVRDDEKKWRRQNDGLPIGASRDIQALNIGGNITPTILAGTPAGLYRSLLDANDLQWKLLAVDEDDPTASVTALVRRGDLIFAGIVGRQGGIYASSDEGKNWKRTIQGLPADGFRLRVSLGLGNRNTIYAALYGNGIYESLDSGSTWQPLRDAANRTLKSTPRYVQSLDFSNKNPYEWLFGRGARDVLYARALDGLYTRADSGQWQLSFPGELGALIADPYHPGSVYGSIISSTVSSGSNSDIASAAINGVMLSQDDGLSWQVIRQVESPVRSLLLDPLNPTLLYIGTENRGVYSSQVYVTQFWPRASSLLLLWIFFSLVILSLNLLMVYLEFRVPPWQVLPALFTMPISLYRWLYDPISLPPLQQLILAFWPKHQREVRPNEVQEALERNSASTSWSQLTFALEALDRQHHLLSKTSTGAYRVKRSILPSIARKRFLTNVELLAKSIREESSVHQEAQQFFKQAGFLPHPTRGGLLLLSPRSDAIFAGIFGAGAMTAQDVDLLWERSQEEYHDRIANRQAYAIVATQPLKQAYERMAELIKGAEHFRVVIISHRTVREALFWGTSATELARSEARVAPDADLYTLEGPAVDALDFFGRQELLRDITMALEHRSIIGLHGAPGVGKTSILWQLKEKLGYPPCIYIDFALIGNRPGDWRETLTSALRAEAQSSKFDWLSQNLTPATFQEESTGLESILLSFRDSMRSRFPEPRLLLLLDTVTTPPPSLWNILIRMARREPFLKVVSAFADRQSDLGEDVLWFHLSPFSAEETSELAQVLLRPWEDAYDGQALNRLHVETAGYPQLVRALCSEMVTFFRKDSHLIEESHVAQAARHYLRRRPQTLPRIWKWFTPEEQEILRALASNLNIQARQLDSSSNARQVLDRLVRLGIVAQTADNYRITMGLLAAWLDITLPGH